MESRFCFARSCQPNVDILTELVLLLADAGLRCVPGCVQLKVTHVNSVSHPGLMPIEMSDITNRHAPSSLMPLRGVAQHP
jgi:hypothetical protein